MLSTLRITVTSPTKAFTHTVLDDSSVKIGRSLRCEFSIPLEDLSREHCLFEIDETNFYITDLGSSNGVWVDRERIPAHTKVLITTESLVVLSNLYQMNISSVEFKTKPENNVNSSAPKEVNRDVQTLSFQLEFPDKEKNFSPQLSRKRSSKPSDLEKESGTTYEGIKMIVGFLVVAAFIVYHMVFN